MSTQPPSHTAAADLIDMDHGLISREAFVSEEIFAQELKNLFPRSWLFVGHESQIPEPGDFFVSRMGVDSVILSRDDSGAINVLLNSCRHRGMKVCRYDEGNTMEFTCPYHGWAYSIDGSLVSTPGELYGVPKYVHSYQRKLDKSEWGLISCPQVKNYRGLIFANWDPEAPSFEDYTGDFHFWLDNLADGLDGTEGAAVAFRGVHKWRVKANWKFIAENFLGDMYHAGPSHQSVEVVGIGPGGKGATRSGHESYDYSRWRETSFTELGHGACDFADHDIPYAWASFPEKHFQDYYREAWEKKVEKNTALGRPLGAAAPATYFPNMSLHSQWMPRTILVAHPVGPFETEVWRWYLVDRDAPDFVVDYMRKYVVRYSGPGGLTEQDDLENWDYATDASRGVLAQRYPYNYSMGIGMHEPSARLAGAVESTATPTEENARNFYRRWARLVDNEDWKSLMANVSPVKDEITDGIEV